MRGDDGTPLNLPIPAVRPLKDGADITFTRDEDPVFIAAVLKREYPQAKELVRQLAKALGMKL